MSMKNANQRRRILICWSSSVNATRGIYMAMKFPTCFSPVLYARCSSALCAFTLDMIEHDKECSNNNNREKLEENENVRARSHNGITEQIDEPLLHWESSNVTHSFVVVVDVVSREASVKVKQSFFFGRAFYVHKENENIYNRFADGNSIFLVERFKIVPL